MRGRLAGIVAAVMALTLVFGALVVTACGGGVPGDAVAVVGDVSVTKAEFDTYMQQAKTQMTGQYGSFPSAGSAEYEQYTAGLVDYLVQQEIIAQGAATLGVSVTATDVSVYIAELETNYGGRDALLESLAEEGMTYALLRDSVRAELVQQAAYDKVVEQISVTTAEVRAFWQENKSAFMKEAEKEDKVATYANTKKEIREGLLNAAQSKAWLAWLTATEQTLGVRYAAGYDPDLLTASPSATSTTP